MLLTLTLEAEKGILETSNREVKGKEVKNKRIEEMIRNIILFLD